MIFGVATNDLKDHKTQIEDTYVIDGKKVRKVVWKCPFYAKWTNMLSRCYNPQELARHPTYEKNFVCDEWLLFSNFKKWMESQNWENKQLDKDILLEGNLEYAPDNCVFVSQEVNKFVLEKSKTNGLPIGVKYNKSKNKYESSVGTGRNGEIKFLGTFDNEYDAYVAWAEAKLKLAIQLASSQEDERVATALVLRYENKLETAKLLKIQNG